MKQSLIHVAQIWPLSPNMFRFMLADLKNYLDNQYGINLSDQLLVHLLWVDDLVLVSDSPQGLQKQLDGLFSFCSRYQMIVNQLNKTKVMIYGNVKNDQFVFSFSDHRMLFQNINIWVLYSIQQNVPEEINLKSC